MLLVQLSDLHGVPEGALAQGVADSNALIAQAVAQVNGLRPQPELVLVTGDLTDDDGSPGAYAAVRARLDRLRAPYRVLVGNHDHRGNLRAAFADHAYLPADGFLHYAFDLGPLRILALDSVAEEGAEGELCPARLAWIEQALAAAPDRPTLVVLHHPPVALGLHYLDPVMCKDGDALGALLARHRQVQAVLCGHVHRVAAVPWQGSLVLSAPAVAYQFPLALEPAAQTGFVLEPPGFLAHLWRPEQRLISHLVPVGGYGPVRPFAGK